MAAFKIMRHCPEYSRATPAIPDDFNERELQDALDATKNAYCPKFLLPDRRKSTVVTTIDFESPLFGEEFGTRTTVNITISYYIVV